MERDSIEKSGWHRDLDSRDGLLVVQARDGDVRALAELVSIYGELTRHHLDAILPPLSLAARETVLGAVREGLNTEIRSFQGGSFHQRWVELVRREVRFARAGTGRMPMAECW